MKLMDRESFFRRAKRIKADIEQMFLDCDHWNRHVRVKSEDPIDPDPDGALQSALAYLDGVLNGEVYIAPDRSRGDGWGGR